MEDLIDFNSPDTYDYNQNSNGAADEPNEMDLLSTSSLSFCWNQDILNSSNTPAQEFLDGRESLGLLSTNLLKKLSWDVDSNGDISKLSTIYSLQNSDQRSIMNNAFVSSPLRSAGLNLNKQLILPNGKFIEADDFKKRLSSLRLSHDVLFDVNENVRLCWSDSNCKYFTETDMKTDILNDSVFIEANHIAEKMADECPLENLCESFILDETPQPEWNNSLTEDEAQPEPLKFNSETVFKELDLKVPANQSVPIIKQSHHISTSTSNDINNEEKFNNLTNESDTVNKDVLEILQNLYNIWNESNLETVEKTKGLNLLQNLSSLLGIEESLKTKENDKPSVSNLEMYQPTEALDLSNKRHSYEEHQNISKFVPAKLSTSCSAISLKKYQSLTIDRLGSVGSSLDSLNEKSVDCNGSGKLKCRTSNIALIKKGPLKAVIPLDMAVNNSKKLKQLTPTQTIGLKKKLTTPTSTKKPVAQSTPNQFYKSPKKPVAHSSTIKTKNFVFPVSPLALQKSYEYQRETSFGRARSDSESSGTTKLAPSGRRLSAEGLKSKNGLQGRRYSIGKENVSPVLEMSKSIDRKSKIIALKPHNH